ncbi:MAG: SBBP repeat-containing protein, partial [Burkholderiales bacterium]
MTGSTRSRDFPTTGGAFQPVFGGGLEDVFVAKLTPAGSALVYSTYLGGSRNDSGGGIALDADGNAYVTGDTLSIDFPTTAGAFQRTLSNCSCPVVFADAFVTKLDPTGSSLVYSTYLGGNDNDYGLGIAVDTARSAYVTGRAFSTNFPTTFGAFQPVFGGGFYDAFVTKLDRTGSTLLYSTYLGGNLRDIGFGIAVDSANSAYVTGHTGYEYPHASNNFPTTPGAFQMTYGGSFDAFVAKLTDIAPPQLSSIPFSGTPSAVPGTFEAENFDLGGEGVAYHDNTAGNQGGQYRPSEDVDIFVSNDPAGGGYIIKNFEAGEWLGYTIDVASGGSYDIEIRASTHADFPNSAYHVEIDGVNVTGTVVLPTTNTTGWSNFQ